MRAVIALFAFAAAAHSATAQALQDTVLHPGVRIRVQSRALGANPRVGSFVSLANDTLSFTPEKSSQLTRLAIAQVDALEISLKRTTNVIRDAAKGKHYGAWIGAIGGGIAGAVGAPESSLRGLFAAIGMVGGYFAGQMYGTIAGGAAGVVDRDDEWKPVTLPVPAPPKGSP